MGSSKEMWIPSEASKLLGSLYLRENLIDLENIADLTHSWIDSHLTIFLPQSWNCRAQADSALTNKNQA